MLCCMRQIQTVMANIVAMAAQGSQCIFCCDEVISLCGYLLRSHYIDAVKR